MGWELNAGDRVETLDGKTARVKSRLGGGGQGEVYLVELGGIEKALKWYKPSALGKPAEFYENLRRNLEAGPPADAFLWPQHLTKRTGGTFGYIMRVRPPGYEDVSKFLKAKIRFGDDFACVNACLKMVNAFKELHRKGYSYQDINDGNFFIHPVTGDLLVCDNDNVAEYGATFGIAGKPGYVAPEIVLGKHAPDIFTDRFSMAVMLFLLLVLARPFEGKMTTVPCLTERLERQFFGERPVFIFDPDNDENRPVRGVHHNADLLWPTYPQYIQQAFIQTFTAGLATREERLTDELWEQHLLRLRDEMIPCPQCGWAVAYNVDEPRHICPNAGCGYQFPRLLALRGKRFAFVIYPGAKLYAARLHAGCGIDEPGGEVVQNKSNPQLWGIRNLTGRPWHEVAPDGKQRAIAKNEVARALRGVRISFESGEAVIE